MIPTRHTNAVTMVLIELSKMGHYAARREVGLFVDIPSIMRLADWVLTNRRKPTRAELYTIISPHKIGVNGELDIQGIRSDGRGFAVEIKIGKDRLRPDQSAWIKAWQKHNGIAGVIRPDMPDWKEELTALLASA